MSITTFFLLLVIINKVYSQNLELPQDSRLNFENFSYPLFLSKEEHSFFKIGYLLNDKLEIEFQNHFNTYALEDRLRASIGLKQYMTEKLYFFGGVELEFLRDKYNNSWNSKPRSSINGGLGYDIRSNLFIEAKGNIQLNETSWGPNGESLIPIKRVYSLGSKWKF